MSTAVRDIFARVPRTYALVNHALTLGLDAWWRRKVARLAAAGGPGLCLDVCTGTGDMARALRRAVGEDALIVAADFSLPMLLKALEHPGSQAVHFCLADADSLPFADETFDVVTISFATRNIHTGRDVLLRRLGEFRRVLKRGGVFVNLETSQPRSPLLRRLVHFYVRLCVKRVGGAISGAPAAYGYLAHTIPRFYDGPQLAGILREAGFADVTLRPLFFSVAAIHEARR